MGRLIAVTLCATVALAGMPGTLVAAVTQAAGQAPPTGTARIVARDAAGKPLAGATVNVTNASGRVVGTSRTNAAGEAVLTLPVGTLNVSIVSGGVAVGSASITVAAGAATTATVTTAVGLDRDRGGALFGLGTAGTAVLVGGAAAGLGVLIWQVRKSDASPSR